MFHSQCVSCYTRYPLIGILMNDGSDSYQWFLLSSTFLKNGALKYSIYSV